MAIHPIEFRYGTPEMKKIWEEENKLQKMCKYQFCEIRKNERN